jgi:hypothetical protein
MYDKGDFQNSKMLANSHWRVFLLNAVRFFIKCSLVRFFIKCSLVSFLLMAVSFLSTAMRVFINGGGGFLLGGVEPRTYSSLKQTEDAS